MGLGAQEIKVHTFQNHLVTRRARAGKAKRTIFAGLMLTSMVDMFSLLVIFLLQSFSSSPELVMVSKGLTLPISAADNEIKDAPVLAISGEGVYLDQKLIGSTEDLLHQPEPLMKKLAEFRDQWQKANPDETFKGEVNLQADKDLPSTTISQFMGMLPSQAYGSVQLAIVAGNAP